MSEIFISYASEDRSQAERLAKALEAAGGWTVWWDRQIPIGQTFDRAIHNALENAKCIIVLWSARAIKSEWVMDEAYHGRAKGILLPVLIEAVDPPFGFERLQAANLIGWTGSPHLAEVKRIIDTVSQIVDRGIEFKSSDTLGNAQYKIRSSIERYIRVKLESILIITFVYIPPVIAINSMVILFAFEYDIKNFSLLISVLLTIGSTIWISLFVGYSRMVISYVDSFSIAFLLLFLSAIFAHFSTRLDYIILNYVSSFALSPIIATFILLRWHRHA